MESTNQVPRTSGEEIVGNTEKENVDSPVFEQVPPFSTDLAPCDFHLFHEVILALK
jgi:hypothetical protein